MEYMSARVRDMRRKEGRTAALNAAALTSKAVVAASLNLTENAVRSWGSGTLPSLAVALEALRIWQKDGTPVKVKP